MSRYMNSVILELETQKLIVELVFETNGMTFGTTTGFARWDTHPGISLAARKISRKCNENFAMSAIRYRTKPVANNVT